MASIQTITDKVTKEILGYKAEVCVGDFRKGRRFDKKSDAKEWAADLETQVRKGTYRDTSDAQKKTLADVLAAFCEEESSKRRTQRASNVEVGRIEKLLTYDICKKNLADLNRQDVKKWKQTRKQETNNQGNPISDSTIKREIAIFRSCIEYAKDPDEGLDIFLHENVFSVSRRRKNKKPVDVKRERIFTKEEKQALLAAIDKCRNKQMRLAFDFAIETGLRKAELVALKFKDWLYQNLEHSLLSVERVEDNKKDGERVFVDMTKNGKKAMIPLTPNAIEILKTLRKNRSQLMVFDTLNYNSLSMAWKRVQKRSGVVDFRWHDLRHVALTQAASELQNAFDVQKVARHSSIEQSAEYVHADLLEIAKKRADAHYKRVAEQKQESESD